MSLFAGSLTTGKLLNGGLFNGGLFYNANREIFYAPLTTTLVPSTGNFSPAFARSTTASVTDFEGIIRTVKINEARSVGTRRVENLYANSETLATQGVSVDAGTYTVSFTGTGTITFSGAYSGALVGTGASNRVETTFSTSAGTLTSTVSGSVLKAQCENVTGQSVQTASEYVSNGVLSFPYHGTGADGVKHFTTKLDGTLIDDGVLKGYFVEGQRTNLLTYSEQFDNEVWTKRNVTITTNATAAPDGTMTACLVTETSSTDQHIIYQSIISFNLSYTGPIYVKYHGKRYVSFRVDNGSLPYAVIDLTMGIVVSGSGVTIKALPNGWYRLCSTKTLNAGSGYITIDFLGSNDIGSISYTGDGTSGIYLWGAQLEQASFADSYIPTISATVTRNTDNLKYQIELPEDGTIYAEVGSNGSDINSGIVSKSLGVGPLNYNSDTGISLMDGTNTHVLTYGQPFSTGIRKVAARWSGTMGTMKLFKDGGAGSEGAYNGAFSGGSEILIGQNNFFGSIRNVKIWNRNLSDSELISMTS